MAFSLLTSAKLLSSYLVVGITRELDKELSLYCYPIYISYKLSRTKEVVLTFFYFILFSHFYFIFNLFSFILFLELGLGLE